MRVRTPTLIILLLETIATALPNSEYGVPIEIQLWDTERSPLAHMVDVTNEFGLKVLAEHNFLNDNNIAFSPYGLTGIMVALYEGVDGESSYQIQRGMQLPWNRNVMRVGFRDIHRTLKTYFVPEEGFLAGLALNNENVTFNENYKKILRFYGFDLNSDQLPTLATPNPSNETNSTESSINVPTTMAPAREDNSTIVDDKEEVTSTPNSDSTPPIDVRIPTTPVMSSSAPNAESTTPPSSTTVSAVEDTTTTELIPTRTVTPSPVQSNLQSTMTTPGTTNTDAVTPVETTTATELSTSQLIPEGTESTINNEVELITTPDTTASAASQTVTESTVSMMSTIMGESSPTTTNTPLTENGSTTTFTSEPTSQTTSMNESTLESLERRKKSIVDFIFMHPPYMQDLNYFKSFDIGPESDSKFKDHVFLVNGLRSVQVSYMQYDSVLEHAYLPHLEASALRLPLDSDRYYLLVVLPSRGGDSELGRLIARMARESDLRDVHAALRPRRVRALVPSFTVKGHVTLTTDLQKMGIRDVFEPRQRDFTPLTSQAGVYVRSVEQAVSVAIRKYQPDDPKRNRYMTTNRYPVHFSATYPFLYFVMDSSIHVALMAGKMVDPLNTRIL